MVASLHLAHASSQSRTAFLQYVRKALSCGLRCCISYCEAGCLSSDSERKLIEGRCLKEIFCGRAILTFYEHLDRVGPEFFSVNDLEHTPVLLFLSVLGIKQEEYLLGPLTLSEVAQVHERTLREEREVSVCKPDVEPATCIIHQARVLAESLWAE